MKGYKMLVPIGLLLIYIISIYMAIDNNKAQGAKYENYIADARAYAANGILVDADSCYKSAVALKPSLELYLEIGRFYLDTNQKEQVEKWGAVIIKEFPKRIEAYEFNMDFYFVREDYIKCFELYDIVQKRKLHSEHIDELIKKIEYSYYFSGEFEDVAVYSGGYCAVKNSKYWGFVNLAGKKVIDQVYMSAGAFDGDVAAVMDQEGNTYYIDPAGNKKIDLSNIQNLQDVTILANDILAAYNGKYWGFYDVKGKYLFGEYEACSSMGNSYAAVQKNGKWGLIDRNGNEKLSLAYDGIVIDEKGVAYRNERIFVKEGYSYYLADCEGNKVSSQAFDDAQLFNDGTFAAVRFSEGWGFIDKDGNVVSNKYYEDARSFSNGMAAVRYAGKWGFIDSSFEWAIEPQFENAKDMNSAGGAFVYMDDRWQLLRLYKYNH